MVEFFKLSEKKKLIENEEKISNGENVDRLKIGQLISLFASGELIKSIAKFKGIEHAFFDIQIINRINDLRIKVEHKDYMPSEADANFVRSSVIKILSEYGTIQEVKEEQLKKVDNIEPDLTTKKIDILIRDIRMFAANNPIVKIEDKIDEDGATYWINFEGEIIGVYEESVAIGVLVYLMNITRSEEKLEELLEPVITIHSEQEDYDVSVTVK